MAKKPDPTKKKKAPRRTRMIALEPRMLFDGALGVDLTAKATAALQGETSTATDTTTAPAAPQPQTETSTTSSVTTEKSAVETTAERLGIAPETAPVRNEVVFVDARVENYERLLEGIDPKATIVFLQADKDGVVQIAETLAQHDGVTAVHIVAEGGADHLQLGSATLSLESMQGLAAQRLSSISDHLTKDATILVRGAEFGKGDAGAAAANRLALLTSADVMDVDAEGAIETVGTPARQEIVFVDPTVRDFQALIDGIDNPNARVVLLDSTRDGVQQIADVLKQYKSVDAVHIISHGTEGQLDLGAGVLNSVTMSGTYADELATIGEHLSKDADLLVYGCDFGGGADGAAAAQALAQLTGADVAASTDATGHASKGGDWDLELKTGAVESDVAVGRYAQEAWQDVLALHTLDFDTVSAWTAGTSKTYTVDGYPVTISYGGSLNGNPALANNYSGGVTPAQDALQFTLGPTGANTITIDFSGQPGGSVSNVGFALYDVDNTEFAVFTANKVAVGAIAPTQIATSAFNSVTASSGTSATVSGSGTDGGATSPNGNTYVYFNTTDITSVSFTYNGTANVTLVVLNDITFMGKTTNPPVVDLDAASTATETAGDAFATQAYTGATGTIPWVGDWVETDATAGGSAIAGQVQVIDTPTAGTDYGLRLNNSGTAGQFTGAAREIDLSGFVTSTMTYSFITGGTLTAADSVVVEVSSNGGTNWTLLKTYTGSSASGTVYTNDSVSLAGYESADTMVRFRISGSASYTAATDFFYVDNVQISGQPTGSTNTYTEGDATGVLIAATANASITDSDSPDMSSARAVIGNLVAGDTLTAATGGTSITSSYDSATGILTLSGTDTRANYQAVLNSIRYLSTSDDPTALGTVTNRAISVTVRDSGGNESNAAISKISLTAVNDAPVNTVPAAQITLVNAPLTLSSANGNALSVADSDATTVRVTIASTNGTLTLSGTAGLTFTTGDGTADATMTFSGTQAQINAALDGLRYNPTAAGAASISMTTSDLGATGTGGTLTDTDSVVVTVLANNILDLNSTPGSVAGAPSTAVTNIAAGGTMTGADGATPAGWTEGGAGAQGAIAGNLYAWTGNSSGAESATLNQNITVPATTTVTTYASDGATLTQTSDVTTNAITSISFDYSWVNSDNNDNNRLRVYYNGVLLGTFDTGIGNNTTGSWTGFGASVTSSVAVGAAIAENVGASITLTFNTPVTANGALSFRFGDATTGVGGDDIALDNVVVNNTATTVTTVTTVDLAANGWNTTYTENGAGVSIADSDSSVFNAASANLTSATVTLTNAQTNDRLLVGGSTGASGTVNGIGWTRAGNTITLSGSFSKAQYADALEQITFDNTSDNPSTTQRVITVQVTDATTSSNVATTTIDVVAVNDAPVNTVSGARSVNEDTALTFTAGNTISVNDAEGNVTSTRLTVGNGAVTVSLAGGATISSGANGSTTLTLSGTQAQINAALATLSYQGNLNFNGADTLTVLSTDSNGATDSDTVAITVNAVNDGPVNTVPAAQAVNEDTALAIGGVSVNDVDGNLSTTRLTVASGAVTVSLAGGATISAGANGSASLTLSGTQAQINAALATISYQGNANFNGADTLTVLSTDSNGLTDSDDVAITVNAVNDAPVNTVPAAQAVNEDTALAIGGVSVNDADGNLSTTRLTVGNGAVTVSLAGGATISAGANGSSTLTLSGTQAQINAALATISYQGNPNFNGADTLVVLSTDSNAITDSDSVAITVNAVNDGPVNTVPGAQSVAEDTALAIGGVSVNDVDGNLASTRLTVANGAVTVSLAGGATISAGANGSATLTLSGTQAQINAALATISYQGNANFNGADTLTVLSTDGNSVTDSDTVAITVNAVNDAPVNTVPAAQAVNEDTALAIGGVSVNDVDGNLATTRLTVTNGAVTVSLAGGASISAGANGSTTLTLSGTQAQINAALATISYQGNPNFNGADTLVVLSTDSNAVTDSDSVAITVNAVNDGPVNTVPAAQAVNEDTALAIGGVSVNDVDGNLSTTRLTVGNGAVTVSLAGGATISAGANGSSTLTLSGTQAQINAALATISYQGNLNFNGADTLTVLSTDGNSVTDSDTVAITVNAVNDGPVNTVPATQAVNEDTALSIGGVSVNDVDGNLATTRLTVSSGAVTVSLAGGAAISAGANGSSTLTLSGTQAQINAALATISYQGNADFNGADTLVVLSTDSNALTDSDSVAITVNAVNDGPINTVPAAQAVNEDTALSIGGISVNDVDGNLSTTRLTVTNGAVTVSLAGGASISAGANGSTTLTLSGTQAQINAALATLSYQGNLNFNGADTLVVLSTDSNALTDSDSVAITVNAVNDGPVNAVPAAQTVNEDTALSIAGVSVNDVDGDLSTTRLTVANGALTVSLAGGATISAGANGSSTLTLSGTQAQINAALATISYQGNSNFNGADTLTVLSTDGNGVTDSDSVAITVNAVNDGPVNTVPAAQSVNEDTALSIAGVSVNDVDGNLSSTRLTVASGAVTVSLAGGATISAGANGSSTLTLSGTQAQINAALATISYQGNLDFNGADTLTVLSTDGNSVTDSDSVAITVNSVNDGPLNTVPAAQSVNEDTALSISGVSVNDVDGNLSTTRLTVTNGAVTVSLAGGASISAGANGSSSLTLAGTQAQINAALASISYQGNLNFNGADTLTVLSTDASGATDSDTVAITVSSVDDGPVNAVPGAQSVNEDTALSIGGISVNDVDGNLSSTRLTVTGGALTVSLAGGAAISSGANGSSTLTLSGTQAQINAALATISYQGNPNFNGADTLTVLSTDGSGATDSDSVAITVSSVNDGPVNTVPGAQAVNEDTALSIAGVSVNDVDGNLATTRLTVASGAVTVSVAGGATISAGANGSSTLTLSGTQAQINAALATISYQGTADFNGADTLTVLSTDGSGATDSDAVAITVNSVNDGPVNTVPGAQTVNEDTALSIAGVSVNDVDANLATTSLTVTNGAVTVSLAGGATISAGANGSSTLTLSGSQAQINAALATISYQGNADFNGADTLTVESTDGNGATDSDSVAITVSSVNDGPVNTVPGAQSVNEDTALSIGGIGVNDVDGNLSTTQLTVSNGALNVSLVGGAAISGGANGSATLTLSGTQAQINAALASLSYQGNANFNGADILTVLSTDSSGATDSDAVAITVSSVNDGPVNAVPGAQTVNEDTSLSIGGISVNDVDGNLATTQLSVTGGVLNISLAGGATISAGANGSSSLTLSGTQAQINAALASISYQGNPNFNGADTLTVLSTDGSGATDSDTVAITVTSVNDGPVNTVPGAQTVNEDTSLSIGGISVNDVDGNLSSTQLTVGNGVLNVSLAGGATVSAGANGSSTLTLSGTQAQINAALASLSYQGNANFNGGDTLTVVSTDANGVADSDAVAISVSSVNDGPVNSVPGARTVNEDTSLSISGVSVNDVDGNLSTTQLSVANGVLNVSLAGGATVSAGANGSSTLTLSGSQAQINAALASISYQGNPNFNGADTLTVLSTDGGGATDSDTVALTVTAVNDGPVNTVPGAQSVNEDTALSIAGVSVNDVDGNLATTQLTVTNGVLNVSLAGGASVSAGANGSSSLTLSGTQAQINAALTSLSYQGNANFNGGDTLTVVSTDANGVADSDALAITVSSVNDGPVNTVPGAQSVNEDTALAIGGISVNDVDGNLATTALTVTSGTLNVSLAGGATISAGANGSSTLTLSGTQAQINAALASVSYQGNPNFNGGDTLTVLSTDGNGATDSDAVAITVSSVNDGPVNTVPGAQAVNEDTPLPIAGLSVIDVDGNLSSTQLTVSNGTLSVSLAGGATISAGANGSSTLTLAGSQAQINAALASLTYQGDADFSGGDTLAVLSTDANGATDADSVAITVSAVNDAPAVTSPVAGTFVESSAGVVYSATRSDADSGDTVTWTLSGPDAALFTIDPATGVVTLNAAQDFASPGDTNGDGIYQITVRATDGAGQFDQRNVQLILTEVPAAPASSIAQPQLPGSGTALSTTAPAAPGAPSTAPALPAFAPPFGAPALGLPVDGGVAPANLGAAPSAAASFSESASVAQGIDLNALPPTAAGMPSTFGLMRVSLELAAAFDILPPESGGHRLFVYHGVPDMRLFVQDSGFLRVPINAFAHTDASAVVTLEARLADGSPLPGWLRFDGLRGVFSGTPPKGVDETLEVEVVARDTDGREARTRFTLEIEAIRNPATAAALALGLDVDKEEAEKARLEAARQAAGAKAAGKAGTATAGVRPANPGAATFSDQIGAAKAQRDPLLERIAPADKAKPRGARS